MKERIQKRLGLILILLIVFGVLWNYAKRHQSFDATANVVLNDDEQNKLKNVSEGEVNPKSTEPQIALEIAKVEQSINPGNPESMVVHYPDDKTVRDEVAKDPHQTPKSLLFFATNLETQMEVALKDEASAKKLMPELHDCAVGSGKTHNSSAEAYCLSEAKRLSDKFATLKDEYSQINRMSDPEVVKLAGILDLTSNH